VANQISRPLEKAQESVSTKQGSSGSISQSSEKDLEFSPLGAGAMSIFGVAVLALRLDSGCSPVKTTEFLLSQTRLRI